MVEGKDGYKLVNYVGLIPFAIGAIQEVDNKVEKLAAENKELKREVASQRERIESLEAKVEALIKIMEKK